jgi:hypothetical protein
MDLPIMTNVRTTLAFHGSDFALVEIDESISPFNTYQPLTPKSQKNKKPLVRYCVRDVSFALRTGHVSILLSESEARSGFLLECKACFMDQSGIFETRKIHIEERLGM